MKLAAILSFAAHSAALAGGLLILEWERPPEPRAISVELVVVAGRGSTDGSAVDRPAPSASVASRAAAAPAEDEPLAREARPAPSDAVDPAAAPTAEPVAALAPIPREKPAPPVSTTVVLHHLTHPSPATGMAKPSRQRSTTPSPATGEGGEGVTSTTTGAGPAHGLAREAASLPGNPAPDYPFSARRRGLEGRVILRLAIAKTGRPSTVTVRKSSGHAVLDRSALEAVKRWRFRPAMRGGEAVDAVIEVPITFRLED